MARHPQPSLFDVDGPRGAYGHPIDPPTVHRRDPSSSREADDAHRESGKRGRNLDLALALVRRWPDQTADELAATLAYDEPDSPLLASGGYELRRRLSDLKRLGLATTGEPRESRVAPFSRQQTYRITEPRKESTC